MSSDSDTPTPELARSVPLPDAPAPPPPAPPPKVHHLIVALCPPSAVRFVRSYISHTYLVRHTPVPASCFVSFSSYPRKLTPFVFAKRMVDRVLRGGHARSSSAGGPDPTAVAARSAPVVILCPVLMSATQRRKALVDRLARFGAKKVSTGSRIQLTYVVCNTKKQPMLYREFVGTLRQLEGPTYLPCPPEAEFDSPDIPPVQGLSQDELSFGSTYSSVIDFRLDALDARLGTPYPVSAHFHSSEILFIDMIGTGSRLSVSDFAEGRQPDEEDFLHVGVESWMRYHSHFGQIVVLCENWQQQEQAGSMCEALKKLRLRFPVYFADLSICGGSAEDSDEETRLMKLFVRAYWILGVNIARSLVLCKSPRSAPAPVFSRLFGVDWIGWEGFQNAVRVGWGVGDRNDGGNFRQTLDMRRVKMNHIRSQISWLREDALWREKGEGEEGQGADAPPELSPIQNLRTLLGEMESPLYCDVLSGFGLVMMPNRAREFLQALQHRRVDSFVATPSKRRAKAVSAAESIQEREARKKRHRARRSQSRTKVKRDNCHPKTHFDINSVVLPKSSLKSQIIADFLHVLYESVHYPLLDISISFPRRKSTDVKIYSKAPKSPELRNSENPDDFFRQEVGFKEVEPESGSGSGAARSRSSRKSLVIHGCACTCCLVDLAKKDREMPSEMQSRRKKHSTTCVHVCALLIQFHVKMFPGDVAWLTAEKYKKATALWKKKRASTRKNAGTDKTVAEARERELEEDREDYRVLQGKSPPRPPPAESKKRPRPSDQEEDEDAPPRKRQKVAPSPTIPLDVEGSAALSLLEGVSGKTSGPAALLVRSADGNEDDEDSPPDSIVDLFFRRPSRKKRGSPRPKKSQTTRTPRKTPATARRATEEDNDDDDDDDDIESLFFGRKKAAKRPKKKKKKKKTASGSATTESDDDDEDVADMFLKRPPTAKKKARVVSEKVAAPAAQQPRSDVVPEPEDVFLKRKPGTRRYSKKNVAPNAPQDEEGDVFSFSRVEEAVEDVLHARQKKGRAATAKAGSRRKSGRRRGGGARSSPVPPPPPPPKKKRSSASSDDDDDDVASLFLSRKSRPQKKKKKVVSPTESDDDDDDDDDVESLFFSRKKKPRRRRKSPSSRSRSRHRGAGGSKIAPSSPPAASNGEEEEEEDDDDDDDVASLFLSSRRRRRNRPKKKKAVATTEAAGDGDDDDDDDVANLFLSSRSGRSRRTGTGRASKSKSKKKKKGVTGKKRRRKDTSPDRDEPPRKRKKRDDSSRETHDLTLDEFFS